MTQVLNLRQAGGYNSQGFPVPPRPSHSRYPNRTHDPGWHGEVELWRGYGFGGLGLNTSQVAAGAGSQVGQAAAAGAAQGNVAQNLVMSAPAIAGGVASAAISSAATGGSIAASTATIAIPIIGVAVAGVTLLLTMWWKNRAQKVAATKVVNEIEPYMQQNLAAYKGGPHTLSSQAQALANFDAGWKAVVDKCGAIGGGGGDRCVTDRDAGSCQWHDGTGTCWNWFSGYRDPIKDDPDVHPDPIVDTSGNVIPFVKDSTGTWVLDQSQSSPLGSMAGGLGGIPTPLLLAGGALVVALMMGGGSGTPEWVGKGKRS